MSILDAETITLKRRSAGSYVNGFYVQGAESSSTINASVQPLNEREVLQLAEGDRFKESLKVLTVTEIRINDKIVRSGKSYEVQKTSDFMHSRLPHYEGLMVLIEEQLEPVSP